MDRVPARYATPALSFGILVAGLLAGGAEAAACGSGKLIREDTFKTLDPAWAIEQKYTKLTAGPDGLTIGVPAGKNVGALYQSGLYRSFELCIRAVTEKPDPNADDLLALRFWTPDGNDEYWAVTWTGRGWFVVNQYVGGAKPKAITPQIKDTLPLHGDGVNEFSVSVNGNRGVFSLNGQKLTDFTGQPPDGGSIFGFLISADENHASTFVLKDLQLREPAAQP